MGYSPAESHEYADELGESFTDDMIERIAERLGHPERCPHGWPIDTVAEQAENAVLAPLLGLSAGAHATIIRLAEHDGDLLSWFYEHGFEPGRELEVLEVRPAADQITVALDGTVREIGEKAAAGIFVRAV
jgi:DtxR family Mn-dependent transcriptional regulator